VTDDQLPAAYHTIVIDGCDGTGKTTLARQLAADHGYTVVHSGRTPDHVDLAGRYRGILAADGPLVLDRCFLSELVYGPLHRHHSRITWDDALELAVAVTRRRGVFVHLTGPPGAVHARLLARDGAAPAVPQIRGILHAYQQVFTRLAGHAPVIHRDINQDPPAAGLPCPGAAGQPPPPGHR
jgi:thymidylate kinase